MNQPWIWPLPQHWEKGDQTLAIGRSLQFDYPRKNDILKQAIKRYQDHLFYNKDNFPMIPYNWSTSHQSKGTIKKVIIQLQDPNDLNLSMTTEESYELAIPTADVDNKKKKNTVYIQAKNVFGALRALETLSQIIQWYPNLERFVIPNAPWSIRDYPKYPFRSLMLDTSRHYYDINDIKKVIETMSWNKFNVFHWHMLDATSFPYQSKVYPELSKKGAYSPIHVYTQSQIKDIVQFAKYRGIRVIPEIEAPGHATAWGYGIPEIVSCLNTVPYPGYTVQPPSGQLNIAHPKTKQVVHAIVDEFAELFPDAYFHASGDEVVMKCWEDDRTVQDYLKKNNMSLQTLFNEFVLEMQNYIRSKNKTVIAWQESVLEYNLTLPKDTVIQVWVGSEGVKAATERGYHTIVSSSDYWYLDIGFGRPRSNPYPEDAGAGFNHWNRMYSYDMRANLTKKEADLIIGADIPLWGELADKTNFESRIWPRASTVAERLWSGYETPKGEKMTSADAILRLLPWRERMLLRGTMASPLNQGFCTRNPLDCFQPPKKQ
ncbi:glycoside hydrolase superfamily [Cunninghamella echinulata]|nr:glycoside hydrolase superfamily [Cunninghamella echinulata]